MAQGPQARTGLAPAQRTSAPAHPQSKAFAAECHTYPSACAASDDTQTEPVRLALNIPATADPLLQLPNHRGRLLLSNPTPISQPAWLCHNGLGHACHLSSAYSCSCPITEHGSFSGMPHPFFNLHWNRSLQLAVPPTCLTTTCSCPSANLAAHAPAQPPSHPCTLPTHAPAQPLIIIAVQCPCHMVCSTRKHSVSPSLL